MELGARHSRYRHNIATHHHGVSHGESNAKVLGECGHDEEQLEMLDKEGIFIKKED